MLIMLLVGLMFLCGGCGCAGSGKYVCEVRCCRHDGHIKCCKCGFYKMGR
jgi:hypothetical protein